MKETMLKSKRFVLLLVPELLLGVCILMGRKEEAIQLVNVLMVALPLFIGGESWVLKSKTESAPVAA